MGNKVEIRKAKGDDFEAIGSIDESFKVTKYLRIIENGSKFQLSEENEPSPYTKKYPRKSKEDFTRWLKGKNSDTFVAITEKKIVGVLELQSTMKQTITLIENILVDKSARGSGVGNLLIKKAEEWSLNKKVFVLKAETQNINLPAINFYKKMGFILGGFDRFLYSGDKETENEIALFWYKTLK